MTRLLVATTNAGKLREIRLILADLAVQILSLEVYPEVPPAEETGQTFAENAREKALYYAAATGILTVAEDSGSRLTRLAERRAFILRVTVCPWLWITSRSSS